MSAGGRGTALIVFAKTPQPGQVKTRLIPVLGAAGAAQLYRWLLERTLAVASKVDFARRELCCTPDDRDTHLLALAGRYQLRLSLQQGTDLGSRMYAAMAGALRGHQRVILIGSDCPQFQAADLEQAKARLSGNCSLVLGPARDGGYVLIGASVLDPRLFSDIPWGTSAVLEQTRERIRDRGWKWDELREFQDIDRPEDLALLAGTQAPVIAAPSS